MATIARAAVCPVSERGGSQGECERGPWLRRTNSAAWGVARTRPKKKGKKASTNLEHASSLVKRDARLVLEAQRGIYRQKRQICTSRSLLFGHGPVVRPVAFSSSGARWRLKCASGVRLVLGDRLWLGLRCARRWNLVVTLREPSRSTRRRGARTNARRGARARAFKLPRSAHHRAAVAT